MKQLKKEYSYSPHDKALSNLVISSSGKLKYREPSVARLLNMALRITPFMAWFVFAGMLVVFSMSIWGVMHPAVAITQPSDMTAYIFLITFSMTALAGMIGLALFMARKKIIETDY